jgi:2-amino-4-hydroxy-6-hydroxymethyldihydropteridine diphosphokinase
VKSAPTLHLACIGLGSNLGQSRKLLQESWQALADHSDIFPQVLSSPYRTRPIGMESPHWFINAVGLLRTGLTPEALLAVLLQVEQRFGRTRSTDRSEYQDRTLDLDLLLFDDLVMHSPELNLPHMAMHERLFVLEPLAEVAPGLRHPLLDKTIVELLEELRLMSDTEDVERVHWLK